MGRIVIGNNCFSSDRAQHIKYDNENIYNDDRYYEYIDNNNVILQATTVKDALDELANNLGGLKFYISNDGKLEIRSQNYNILNDVKYLGLYHDNKLYVIHESLKSSADSLDIYDNQNKLNNHFDFRYNVDEKFQEDAYPFFINYIIEYKNEIHIFGESIAYKTVHYKLENDNKLTDVHIDQIHPTAYYLGNILTVFVYNDMLFAYVNSNYYDDPSLSIEMFNDNATGKHNNWTGRIHKITYSYTGFLEEIGIDPQSIKTCESIVCNNEVHFFLDETYHVKFDGEQWVDCGALPFKLVKGYCLSYQNKIYVIACKNVNKTYYCYKFDGEQWVEIKKIDPLQLPYVITSNNNEIRFINKLNDYVVYKDGVYNIVSKIRLI